MATWRATRDGDFPGIIRVACQVHPNLPESDDVYAERLGLFPAGCLVLADTSDQIFGYAISHPIRRGQPPALDSMLGEIAPGADQYYIHDVAILPALRGHGFAAEGIARLLGVAGRSYDTTSLVSVYGTAPFWGRFGFVAEPFGAVSSEKLLSYGGDAVYLARRNR